MLRELQIIIVAIIVFTIFTVSVTAAPMTAYAWELDVNLQQSEFGTDRAEVTVRGPFGWFDNKYVRTGPPPLIASFDVPDREIPEGYYFEVCVGAGIITVFPNCESFVHSSEDESVTMFIPR
jgi:hypothetical protein